MARGFWSGFVTGFCAGILWRLLRSGGTFQPDLGDGGIGDSRADITRTADDFGWGSSQELAKKIRRDAGTSIPAHVRLQVEELATETGIPASAILKFASRLSPLLVRDDEHGGWWLQPSN